jgi:tripartite-type tricarboxylate transporter receptor subunit TctC
MTVLQRLARARVAIVGGLALLFCGAGTANAEDVSAVYKGRVVTWVLATTPGGSWDVYLRTMAQRFGDHIPGNPKVVIQYMPGAGGLRVLDYMSNVAPKDGLTIATPLPTSLLAGVLEPEKANFKPERFNWVGSMARIQDVVSIWHGVPVKSIEDAKKRVVLMGVTGTGSNTYFDIAIANNLLGTKFKPVSGYQGSIDIDLAIERGEVEGRANTWDGWAAAKPAWLKDKLITNIVQIGLSKLPEIGDVPLMNDLVKPEDRKLVEFLSAGIAIGRTVFMPPDVPADRVAAMRTAFAAAVTDPDYVKQAKSLNLSTDDWMGGEDLQKLVGTALNGPPELLERAKAVLTIK